MSRIRTATPADCDAIGEVHVAAWRETYAPHLPAALLAELSAARRSAMWRQTLAAGDPETLLMVAEDDGGLVGFAACRRGAPTDDIGTDGEVSAVYLLRRAQRHRTGCAMVTRLFSFMAASGMRSAGLWVLRENAGARAFYRRLGAVEGTPRPKAIAGVPIVEIACRWRPIPPRPVAPDGFATT